MNINMCVCVCVCEKMWPQINKKCFSEKKLFGVYVILNLFNPQISQYSSDSVKGVTRNHSRR